MNPDDKFLAVDIQTFRGAIRDISFDVFLKLSEDNYAHVFSKTTGLDYKRLAQYIQKGVTHFHIREVDQASYQLFISKKAEDYFNDPATPTEKKIATLINMTEASMAELFTQIEVDEATAKSTQKVIKNYVDMMVSSPKTLSMILKLVSHGEYLYYHSIAVSVFSMFIAKASGQFNRRMLEIVGLGGFLHDIGMTQLPKDVTQSEDELSEKEWEVMRSHPKIGMQMVEKATSIPEEVKFIIYQHHEQPSGQGYPNSLRGPVIYYPAKIVGLADSFSALISNRPFRKAYTVDEAIQILESETGKFDRELVKILPALFQKPSSKKAA